MTLNLRKLGKQLTFTLLVTFFYSIGSTYMVPETDLWTRFYNNFLSFMVFAGAVLLATKVLAEKIDK